MVVDKVERIRAYVGDYNEISPSGLNGWYRNDMSRLGNRIHRAGDILRSSTVRADGKLTPPQISFLEDLCDYVELYQAVGREFSDRGYRPRLVSLYETVNGLFLASVVPGGSTRKRFLENKRLNGKRLKLLGEGQIIYPVHINQLRLDLGELEKNGEEVTNLPKQVDELKRVYWEIFKAIKAAK